MQINPLWTYGPYNPAQVTAGSQPDWYMGFVEGAIRIMPNWESHIGGTTWSWNVAIPGLGSDGAVRRSRWPSTRSSRQWVTGDKSEHHILDRPRNVPTRTAFGVAAMTCYGLFWIGGGNDIIATQFHVSLNSVTYFLRVAVFVGPVIAFMVTKRICIGLQRADEERLLHGVRERASSCAIRPAATPRRTRRSARSEAYTLTQHVEPLALAPVAEQGDLSDKELKAEKRRRKATRFWYLDALRKPTRAELGSRHAPRRRPRRRQRSRRDRQRARQRQRERPQQRSRNP